MNKVKALFFKWQARVLVRIILPLRRKLDQRSIKDADPLFLSVS